MHFMRSQSILSSDGSMDATGQSNSVSHFIDMSIIYGSSDAVTASVRSGIGGQLKITNGVAATMPNCEGSMCYFTGDGRAMLNPTLALWHSVFIRYHNHIADHLFRRLYTSSGVNARKLDELVFQETRRILMAVYQNIVFNEWLPLYLGDVTSKRNVSCKAAGYCGRFDETVNPSSLNEFSNGAFRMMHFYIPETTNYYDHSEHVL